ncbi:hypothetical protein [Demequina soli]|uniref:hypothetical protein n=1 Tax=Demequina soli TaxID=1638987 RepID=UPI0007834941|nr:hypothetical protein [Demequina soli]
MATTTTAASAAPTPTRVDPTVGFRRIVSAAVLPVAFACQLAANVIYAIAVDGGIGDGGTGAQTLEFYAAHIDALVAATVLAIVGVLLAIPGILAAMRVTRPSKPRLSLWAGALMIAGYACYLGIVFTDFPEAALAQAGVDAGAALDNTPGGGFAAVFFLIFVVGNLVGTLLMGLAVLLGRGLPRFAGVLILGWPVGHVTNLILGNEWFAVAGGALEVIGLFVIARTVMLLSNEEWVARG